MIAVTGSAAAAERQLERMKDVARLPGLGFREAIQGSIRLQAVGISAQNAERYLKAFGNAVATTGGGKNELDRITTQLGQLAAKGKALAQDIRPIIEAAPAVGKAMRDAFGTVDTEAIQKSGITMSDFLNRLVTQLEKLPPVTGGAKNAFENLTDSMYRARVAIGDALLPSVVPLIEGLAKILEKVKSVNPETVRWALAIAGVAAVAGPLVLVISSVTTAVTALSTAIGFGLLPAIVLGGPVVIALGVISALFVKNKLDALAAAAATEQYRSSLIGLSKDQLIQERFKQTEALSRAREEQERLRTTGGAFIRRSVNPRANLSASAPTFVPTAEMQDAVEAANSAWAHLRALQRQEELLKATTVSVNSTPLDLGGGKAHADRLAGTLDRVNDELREFLELSRFEGVTLPEQLPAAFSEQLTLTQRLGDQVDRLSDGLNKLGARAPQGAINMLANLRAQLSSSREELVRMSAQWNALWARAIAPGIIQVPVVASAPATQRSGIARGVEESLGLGAAGTGSMLGDLGRNASLTTRALSALQEGATQLGRTFGASLANMAGRAGEFAGNVVSGARAAMKAGKSFAAAVPAAAGVAAALEIVGGFLSALQPVLDAVTLPLRMLGEILSLLIIPVMRILFPVFKVVAIVASYLGETVAKVVGAILNAIGGFIKAIGKLINAITPFANPGNPLVRAGQAMQNTAQQFRSAADEMAKKRKELEHLSFDDALKRTSNAANRLSESMSNAVEGFKILRYRFAATDGVNRPPTPSTPAPPATIPTGTGGGTGTGTTPGGGSGPFQPVTNTFNITVDGNQYGLRDLIQDIQRYALAVPEARGVAKSFPVLPAY